MNIINEFYKRFDRFGEKAESVSVPHSVCLLGTPDLPTVPSVGISLSFGTECAYRKRKDDRIIIKYTDSPNTDSVNITDTKSFYVEKSVKQMLNSISQLTEKMCGAELLLHSDTSTSDFSHKRLCAVKAYSAITNSEDSFRTIIKAAASAPFEIVSVIPDARFVIINNITLDYFFYPFNFDGYKIVCIKSGNTKHIKPSSGFIEREKCRINCLDTALKTNNICELGDIISESGKDIISISNIRTINNLYSFASDFTKYIRPFYDYSGLFAIIENEKCDEFIKVIGLKHQKKTGKKPVFYISD